MTPQKTHILLVATQGISVQTKASHQRSHCFTRVGLRWTGPSQLMPPKRVFPRSGLGSMKLWCNAHKYKAIKAYNWKHKSGLILRYTPLIKRSPAESPVLWYGGKELTVFFGMLVCVLHLFLQNVAVSKSRHLLLFCPTRKGKKHNKIPFRDVSRVREVDYRKGRC